MKLVFVLGLVSIIDTSEVTSGGGDTTPVESTTSLSSYISVVSRRLLVCIASGKEKMAVHRLNKPSGINFRRFDFFLKDAIWSVGVPKLYANQSNGKIFLYNCHLILLRMPTC